MLEKPDLQDEKIIACLREEYGLAPLQVTFLPLGYDQNTVVYRVTAQGGSEYFLKLRNGVFNETSVALPVFLSRQGIEQIIPPIENQAGQLWGRLESFKTILYPFIEGQDGYQAALSASQWVAFGQAVKRLHTVELPSALAGRIRRETYSPHGRETVKKYLENPDQGPAGDPPALKLAQILKDRRAEIGDLFERARQYAEILRARPPQFTLCHSDLHAGNLLISRNGVFYIVDWDDPIMAPKERDLMFIGGGQGFTGVTPQEEEQWFYQGYGPVQIDRAALAYYRYERIVQDIAVFCEQIFASTAGGEDRELSIRYVRWNFMPGGTLAMAYRADPER
jgi:spectinomycin phosphotransferase